jgi:asparagine synthase (glutamine-hydrolysing)
MCGICGIAYADGKRRADRGLLEAMNDRMFHRGPDEAGVGIYEGAALAMRRLAIIDLATGQQPISNEDGTIHVVFNGEIFNFKSLRTELKQRGHVFKTGSDTEVIVHAYEEYGTECATKLRGQFGFAVWDENERSLLIGRDRMGQKPLYYTVTPDGLIFASEIKCLLVHPEVSRQPDLEAIHDYLTLGHIPEPKSGLKGIHKLPPGHILKFHAGDVEISEYWRVRFEPKIDEPFDDVANKLRETIREAVQLRLISDVPLGAHLSGGLDSSIVVALMAEQSTAPVRTFSIGFEESGFNETKHSRAVAEHLSTEHEEFIVDPSMADVLPQMVDHFGEPFADPAALPTWYLARETRRFVTVALNGDGADESFAGYNRYVGDRLLEVLRRLPSPGKRALSWLAERLPVPVDRPLETSPVGAIRQLSRALQQPRGAGRAAWTSQFSEAEKAGLYTPAMREAVHNDTARLLSRIWESAEAHAYLDRTLSVDLAQYLPGALLPKVDRMTMAHSLEARSPFLDHHVVELAARLPVKYKIRGWSTKFILRDLFPNLLPPHIKRRGKMGFNVPLGVWLKKDMREFASDHLLAANSPLGDYMKRDSVERLLADHGDGRRDNAKRIYALLCLDLWWRAYVCPGGDVRLSATG